MQTRRSTRLALKNVNTPLQSFETNNDGFGQTNETPKRSNSRQSKASNKAAMGSTDNTPFGAPKNEESHRSFCSSKTDSTFCSPLNASFIRELNKLESEASGIVKGNSPNFFDDSFMEQDIINQLPPTPSVQNESLNTSVFTTPTTLRNRTRNKSLQNVLVGKQTDGEESNTKGEPVVDHSPKDSSAMFEEDSFLENNLLELMPATQFQIEHDGTNLRNDNDTLPPVPETSLPIQDHQHQQTSSIPSLPHPRSNQSKSVENENLSRPQKSKSKSKGKTKKEEKKPTERKRRGNPNFKVPYTNKKPSKQWKKTGASELSADNLTAMSEDEKLQLTSWGLPAAVVAGNQENSKEFIANYDIGV